MHEYVILVDEFDREIGTLEKIEAHIKGKLHRAFSIFIFNKHKKLLIHKRAISKYHSGGLWTNACCSHPRPGEILEESIHRRLREEMGFDCELKEIFAFKYEGILDRNIIEKEFDHVFIGEFNGEPNPNPNEVDDFIWIGMEDLKKDIILYPDKYSVWFKIAINRVMAYIIENVIITES